MQHVINELKLPKGYDWEDHSYVDDQGYVIHIAIVRCRFHRLPFSKLFRKEICHGSWHSELNDAEEDIKFKSIQLKNRLIAEMPVR